MMSISKFHTFTFLLALLGSCIPALAVEADAIVGYWVTEGAGSVVQVIKRNNTYSAKIVALKNPIYRVGEVSGMDGQARLDLENPEPTLRQRPLIGMEFLSDFTFDGDQWSGGKIYDPQSGNTYRSNLTLNEQGQLQVRGYVGVSLLGRTSVWIRLDDYKKSLAGLFAMLEMKCP